MRESLTGNLWNIKNTSEVDAGNIVDVLLDNRGLDDDFLAISLKNSMPDPYSIVDMEKVINRIYEAILNRQPIAILGDYDVDGVCSTSIFLKFFKEIGVDCVYSIPNRVDEGYGLSIRNIDAHKGHLIIAVDCGSSSFEELTYAKDNNIDIVVIDHHQMTTIPETIAVVNPHRPDEKDTLKHLCATGLVFMCVVGLARLLKQKDFFKDKEIPKLLNYLDFVALATVCDIVPLDGLNRAFVANGLKVIQQKKNLGISALLSLNEKLRINAETIAFFIGPHLNAAGRLKSADLSVKLLTTEDSTEAYYLSEELAKLNDERRKLENSMIDEAKASIDEKSKFICVYNPEWHSGIIGIVAGRLRERYNKPSIVISSDADGIGKASCRSVEGLDIADVIKKGVARGIITSGGGHLMAGGFSLSVENISTLQRFLEEEIDFESKPRIFDVDAILDIKNIGSKLIDEIETLQPFGEGNRSPIFVISNAKIISAKIIKEKHISITLSDKKGKAIKGISFKSVNTPLGDILLNNKDCLDFLGELSVSTWKNHKQITFLVRDVAKHIAYL